MEGYFLFSSIFASRAYYAFGFLALTAAVVALTTATVSILFVYFLLCAEDYRWHWRSFFAGGGSALWLFIYGVYHWASRMSLDSTASVILYFGYLILLCVMNFIVTGAEFDSNHSIMLITWSSRYYRLLSIYMGSSKALLCYPHRLNGRAWSCLILLPKSIILA